MCEDNKENLASVGKKEGKKRLCEALLRADSEAAHEEYETDSEFRAEVERGVNSLLERYAKETGRTHQHT